MEINRRQFVIITAASAAGAFAFDGARADEGGGPVVDAGPLGTFAAPDVYDSFREQGFFVVRRGTQLFALSSICTHKGCKVRVQDDRSFLCKCHKSRFDPDGKVLNGPATRNLPRLAVKLDDAKHVLVDTEQKIEMTNAAYRAGEDRST